jgi:hypothetical protein
MTHITCIFTNIGWPRCNCRDWEIWRNSSGRCRNSNGVHIASSTAVQDKLPWLEPCPPLCKVWDAMLFVYTSDDLRHTRSGCDVIRVVGVGAHFLGGIGIAYWSRVQRNVLRKHWCPFNSLYGVITQKYECWLFLPKQLLFLHGVILFTNMCVLCFLCCEVNSLFSMLHCYLINLLV